MSRVRTFQATMAQLREPLKMEVAIPADAVPGRGGINVEVKARIADGLAGIKEYMSLYPYSCLEQKISKAVALGDRAAWDRIMSELPAYLDSDGLAKYFPTMDYGSDVMTAYLLAIANEAGYPVPRQERMIEGLKRVCRGKDPPARPVRPARSFDPETGSDRGPVALRRGRGEDAYHDHHQPGHLADVRRAGLDKHPAAGQGHPSGRREAPGSGERPAHAYLLPGNNHEFLDREDRLPLVAHGDAGCQRGENAAHHPQTARLGKGRPAHDEGHIGRMQRGHWGTTIANAWGVLAAGRFSEKYESVPVTGLTTATLDRKSAAFDWSAKPHGDRRLPALAGPQGQPRHNARGDRQPVGHGAEPGSGPAETAAHQRFQHQENHYRR